MYLPDKTNLKNSPGLGLCCISYEEEVDFKSYTWKTISQLLSENRIEDAKAKISRVWENNITSTQHLINYCAEKGIGSYRISSNLFPHFKKCREILGDISPFIEKMQNIKHRGVKLSLHPGQFVSLGSSCPIVLENSIRELEYHFFIAENIGFDEINIHMGGCYNEKENAKNRFFNNVQRLLAPEQISKLTLENDELNYGAVDVIEMCERLGTRFTFDVHHHKCYSIKEKTIDEELAFQLARKTWKGSSYQRMHLSSPRDGYTTPVKSRTHSLFIHESDFPEWVLYYENVQIDIEAKAKEQAIFRLQDYISKI